MNINSEAIKLMESKSLLEKLRSKRVDKGENRILIPDSFQEDFPFLYERLKEAADFAQCVLIKDSSMTIKKTYTEILVDPTTVGLDDVIERLQKKPVEFDAVMTVAAMFESLTSVPDGSAFDVAGGGRFGIISLIHLTTAIYGEQVWDIPLAKQKRWWKYNLTFKKKIEEVFTVVFGKESSAKALSSAIEIIYRKFIRRILNAKKTDGTPVDGAVIIHSLAQSFIDHLFATGEMMFMAYLTKKKVERIQRNKTNKNKLPKDREKVKATKLLRPTIKIDRPTTDWEKISVGKIQQELNKVEKLIPNFSTIKHGSPDHWEKGVKSVVEGLYAKTKFFNAKYKQRSNAIRSKIYAGRPLISGPKAGLPGLHMIPDLTKPKPEEWMQTENLFKNRDAEEWEMQTISCISNIFEYDLTKAEIDELDAPTIRKYLNTAFSVAFATD